LEDFEKDKKNPPRLYGSGMYVINAPWHLAEEGQKTVNLLQKMLFQK
jgi:23S rRNA (adenine2030-N6)-methyltransferase